MPITNPSSILDLLHEKRNRFCSSSPRLSASQAPDSTIPIPLLGKEEAGRIQPPQVSSAERYRKFSLRLLAKAPNQGSENHCLLDAVKRSCPLRGNVSLSFSRKQSPTPSGRSAVGREVAALPHLVLQEAVMMRRRRRFRRRGPCIRCVAAKKELPSPKRVIDSLGSASSCLSLHTKRISSSLPSGRRCVGLAFCASSQSQTSGSCRDSPRHRAGSER